MEAKKQEHALNLYKPLLQDAPQVPPRRLDDSVHGAERMSIDQCETVPQLDDSQLLGAPVEVSADADVAAGEREFPVKAELNVAERGGGRRRRGRPPRFQARASPKNKDEEDVCFICFDGGSLVLCDRRGCPKAYHPACIKRDEAFFRSKSKWNCGWHICSRCQKAAHYMCYTCTYSLCKPCTKDADYLCVRENKGFCGMCMKTIMLIENNAPGNKEMVQVDFDDQSSWEYLFKVYWIYLKDKLSLTLGELTQAKNPWKGEFSLGRKRQRFGAIYYGTNNKGFISYGSLGDLEANKSKMIKTEEQPKFLNKEAIRTEKSSGDRVRSLPEGMEWASKELLEFVAHMKNGDTSILSHVDVQALVLEYIKRNSLHDPHEKCQIVCDMRLANLFGKDRVAHLEMLKLLESHFLIKENPPSVSVIQGGVVDSVTSQVEPFGTNDNQLGMCTNKRRKALIKHDEKGPHINLDEYAAIDVHNINLIYLRRALMENLIDDNDKFHDKVVGSIVRIKIASSDKKQDIHRLVRVVGTSKVAKPYNIGNKATDVMLEILNLDKREVISIDGISNQEFSEDECKCLQQSIKCGLINPLTVGEIQAQAMTLQAIRVDDLLETEIMRLNHLRDQASEHRHRKKLRECVEKLQLLNSPEERQRRLHEIPEVHIEPNMDPNYKSEDTGELDDKKQDDEMRPRGGDVLKDDRNSAQNNLASSTGQSRSISAMLNLDKKGASQAQERVNKSSWDQGRDASDSNNWDKSKNQVYPIDSVTNSWNNGAVVTSQSFSASETSMLPLTTGMAPSANDDDSEKIWLYQDPTGKIQGPFSLVHLGKWSTSGHFPPDLRIWRINGKQDDSQLLIDALNGQHLKTPPLIYNNDLLSQLARVASACIDNDWGGSWSGSMNPSPVENNKKEGSWNSTCNDATAQSKGNNDFVRSSGGGTCSSWTVPAGIVNSSGGQSESYVQGWDSSKRNNCWSGEPQVLNSLPSHTFHEKPFETPSHQGSERHKGEAWNCHQNNGDLNSRGATEPETNSGCSYEKQQDGQEHASQSSGQNWRPPPINSSNGCDSSSVFVSEGKPVEISQRNQETDFPDLPGPTPKPGNEDLKCRAAEIKKSASLNLPVQVSGLSWSTTSSLGGGGAQVPEVAGGSPTPAKPLVEEWDINIVPVTSLKPIEMASDHTGSPTSGSGQLTHFPPSHPASNTSSWQAIVAGSDELGDESVSDLLAEVEAMESLAGIPSPTSIMNCGGDLAQGPKSDCFSSVEEFSPVLDPAKSDALSTTGVLQIPSQSSVTGEPHGVSHSNVRDPQKRSGRQPSSSLEINTKLSDVSVDQWDAGSDIQPFALSTRSLDLAATDTTWRAGSETTVPGGRTVRGNANLAREGLVQGGNSNMAWGAGQGATQTHANANVNRVPAAWSSGISGSEARYGSRERAFSPRDRAYQGGDSGFSRGRYAGNRQSYGGGNGGAPVRPPAKGQRVCKFYENGYCKKGASCSYLHP